MLLRRIHLICLCLAAAGMFLLPIAAHAGPIHFELGDAGSNPGTAQLVDGDAPAGTPVTNIIGAATSLSDGDVYRIFIGSPSAFSATTVGQPGTLIDTALHVYTNAGTGIIGNDDVSTFNFRSTIPAGSLTGFLPGFYLLSISAWDNDPVDLASMEIFTDNFPGLQFPIGGVGPLAGFNGGGFSIGTYNIALTGVVHTTPEPGSLLVFATSALGLVGHRWRQRRRTSAESAAS